MHVPIAGYSGAMVLAASLAAIGVPSPDKSRPNSAGKPTTPKLISDLEAGQLAPVFSLVLAL
jgi:hypothetical protein